MRTTTKSIEIYSNMHNMFDANRSFWTHHLSSAEVTVKRMDMEKETVRRELS